MSNDPAKHEWRKAEKAIYLPKRQPEVIELPAFKYITIRGDGNPNGPEFAQHISALYPIAYGIKMTAKRPDCILPGHYDYTVYPLEGVWDLNERGRQQSSSGPINKDDLVYTLMIRQPDFVDEAFFEMIKARALQKQDNPLIEKVRFETISEGRCIQMLHVGPFDDEPASFQTMEVFAQSQGLKRHSKRHREIYLSDFRKTAPEKLKTVLRFQLV